MTRRVDGIKSFNSFKLYKVIVSGVTTGQQWDNCVFLFVYQSYICILYRNGGSIGQSFLNRDTHNIVYCDRRGGVEAQDYNIYMYTYVYRGGSHKITVGANDFPLPAQSSSAHQSLTLSLTPPPPLVRSRVSHAFLYLRRFFLKLLYSFSLSPPPSENNDSCVYPKVNYLPLRRFSYPFGVGTTVCDFAVCNIIYTRTHD